MKKIIAERGMAFVEIATGVRKNLIIRIGPPRWIENEGYAVCPREYSGLFENVADAIGVDELQALQLASDVDSMLAGWKDKYIFYWANGDRYFED